MKFPSAEWLDALAAEAGNNKAALESFGFCDMRLGLKIEDSPEGEVALGLRLEGYDVTSDGEVNLADWKPDCVLEGPYDAWKAMLESIATNGAADLGHTLNALTLAEVPMRVTADSPLGRDLFYRYSQSLQEIFDLASKVSVDFAEVSA